MLEADAETAGWLVQLPLRMRGVPKVRLSNSAFWMVLLRPLVWPSAAHGPALIYEQLLPFLNARPVLANIAVDTPVDEEEGAASSMAFAMAEEQGAASASAADVDGQPHPRPDF